MTRRQLHTTPPPYISDFSFWITDSQLIYSPHALRLRFYDERIEAHIELALQDWSRVQDWVEENVALPAPSPRHSAEQRLAERARQIYDYVDVRMLASEAYRLYLDLMQPASLPSADSEATAQAA